MLPSAGMDALGRVTPADEIDRALAESGAGMRLLAATEWCAELKALLRGPGSFGVGAMASIVPMCEIPVLPSGKPCAESEASGGLSC